jgi:hypothetical protein
VTKYLEKKQATDGSVLNSYFLPGISFQDDVIRTESNNFGAESDMNALALSQPMMISVERVTQYAVLVEHGTMDEAILDALFKKSSINASVYNQ